MRGSAAGMKRLVHGPQVVAVDVRVQLRGGQVRVTEHFLDGAKVGTTLEQVGRERVPEGVRCHPLREPREPGGPLDDRPCAFPLSRLGRISRAYNATAPNARRPTGTIRSFEPLPKMRASPSSYRTSCSLRPTNSDTRAPVAYANSSNAPSRIASGSSALGAASSRSISATDKTVGRRRHCRGDSRRSLGSRVAWPSPTR